MTAGEAVRAVLKTQLGAMQTHEPGVIADRDPEELHRYRVALRRTRSCIGQMKRALPPKPIAKFKPEFAWLGSITGPTRDLDVFLDDLTRYRKKMDKATRSDFDPLIELVRTDRRGAQEQLVARLDSDRYRSLIGAWQKFLDAPFEPADAPHVHRPIAEVAAERIRARHESMIRKGRKIDATTDTERLHRLRIEGKKLRYLLEFFRDEFPAATIEPGIATLKKLQDLLGRFNDLRVQQESIQAMTGRIPAGTAGVTGRLLERLAEEERRVRCRFAAEFERFADTGVLP